MLIHVCLHGRCDRQITAAHWELPLHSTSPPQATAATQWPFVVTSRAARRHDQCVTLLKLNIKHKQKPQLRRQLFDGKDNV